MEMRRASFDELQWIFDGFYENRNEEKEKGRADRDNLYQGKQNVTIDDGNNSDNGNNEIVFSQGRVTNNTHFDTRLSFPPFRTANEC